MSTDRKPLVEVRDVHKKFLHEGREVEILRGIDLVIEHGEMLAVVGASGAGKSTLLHILGTLDLPTSGKIFYEGADITSYSASRLADFRNHRLGFVFQFHHLLPEFTALENVMMPGMIRGSGRGPLKKRALELLDEVGLSHRLSHRPGELSGGEQQRVALARALVMEPKLILADEPTGNLDSKTSEAIHALLFELNRSRGTTFMLVTHARDLADRMPRKLTMRDGRIEIDSRVGAPYRSSHDQGMAGDAPDREGGTISSEDDEETSGEQQRRAPLDPENAEVDDAEVDERDVGESDVGEATEREANAEPDARDTRGERAAAAEDGDGSDSDRPPNAISAAGDA